MPTCCMSWGWLVRPQSVSSADCSRPSQFRAGDDAAFSAGRRGDDGESIYSPAVPAIRPIEAYLFDLDGTLIDSIGLIMSSYRHTMMEHLGEIPADHAWRSGLGTPLRTQIARFARTEHEVDAMTSTYVRYTERHHDLMVVAYPGIREALESLRRTGRKLAIVTSKNRRSMWRGLRLCGLEGFFDAFVTVDDVDAYKPDPAPVVKALESLAASADATVFIGDSPHDVAAGRAAGVKTAAALWGPFSRDELARQDPDHWLVHPSEIPTFIEPNS